MVPEAPVQILRPGAKEPLAALRFVPWQDGGVIVLTGKFPLDGLLIFAGLKPNSWTVLRQPSDLQVSSVLPMDRRGFALHRGKKASHYSLLPWRSLQDLPEFTEP